MGPRRMKESDTGGDPDQLGQPDKPRTAQEWPLSLSQPRGVESQSDSDDSAAQSFRVLFFS